MIAGLLMTVALAADGPERTTVKSDTTGQPRFGASLELGSVGATDPAFDVFKRGRALASFGFKLGYRALDNLVVVGSYHRSRTGAQAQLEGFDGAADFESEGLELATAFTSDQFTLGPRVDVELFDLLLPYATVQGLVVRGVGRLDDDPEVNNNPNQIRGAGVGAGVMAFGGAEIVLPRDAPVQFVAHLELGYGYVSRIGLGDLGAIQPGGFAARGGFGARF